MGKVTDHLVALIEKEARDRGVVVVWFDPERVYEVLAADLVLPDLKVFRYQATAI